MIKSSKILLKILFRLIKQLPLQIAIYKDPFLSILIFDYFRNNVLNTT